jgi:hypothetical protein
MMNTDLSMYIPISTLVWVFEEGMNQSTLGLLTHADPGKCRSEGNYRTMNQKADV